MSNILTFAYTFSRFGQREHGMHSHTQRATCQLSPQGPAQAFY